MKSLIETVKAFIAAHKSLAIAFAAGFLVGIIL